VFRNCIFRNNTSYWGGGMHIINSHVQSIVEDCLFENNIAEAGGEGGTAGGHGGGLMCYNNNYIVRRCVFVGNDAVDSGAGMVAFTSKPGILQNNVFRDQPTRGQALALRFVQLPNGPARATYEVSNCVITGTYPGRACMLTPDQNVSIVCTDIYDNVGGNWDEALGEFQRQNGNLSMNPLFCSEISTNLDVCEDSPLLAANNACGEDIGLSTAGCDSCGNSEPPPPPPGPAFQTYVSRPNPYHVSATSGGAVILYDLPTAGHVRAIVYDVTGRRIRMLEDGPVDAGTQISLEWDGMDDTGRAVASGIYVCRVEAAGQESSQRITLVR
jgi:hypothetical protein